MESKRCAQCGQGQVKMTVGGPQEGGICQEGCRQSTNSVEGLAWAHWCGSEEEMVWQDGVGEQWPGIGAGEQ